MEDGIVIHPRALEFARAYRGWLDRPERSVTEPVEPKPSAFGISGDLAEALRATIHRQRDDELMSRVKANNPPKPQPAPAQPFGSPGQTTATGAAGAASISKP
jgi:hypothetical protein